MINLELLRTTSPSEIFPSNPAACLKLLIHSPLRLLTMSADTRPISPGRFAAALKELSVNMLHLKVLEIRNSIAHLQYSNDQLEPFAKGSATAIGDSNAGPDQDCIDAIRENEQVIDRMIERIALVRAEVEERGVSWTEFMSKEEVESQQQQQQQQNGEPEAQPAVNGQANASTSPPRHSAWSDGTFQTGTISNGQVHLDQTPGQPSGGSLSDEELRRALEARMRDLSNDDDDADGGMHL